MRLSTRSRYGTRLLVDMARHYSQGPIHLSDIARRQGVSVKYLEQIIIPLKKAGLVQSVRGPKGGHQLARPPAEITVADIVSVLEEGLRLVECTARPEVCDRAQSCPTRMVWAEATQAMLARLKNISLADLARLPAPEEAEGLPESPAVP
ncbi:MAG: Rrf2 family transcriptional regulator [Syntrophobacterales bacterium]|nr:Rrf2 family transcriptional regulator [Syntrophobacterales bacterium]